MAVSVIFPNKDPEEILDYTFDYTDWLVSGAEVDDNPTVTATIESASPTESPYTLSIDQIVIAHPNVTIWLSGGTLGAKYIIKLIGTDDQNPQRTYVRRASIKLRAK